MVTWLFLLYGVSLFGTVFAEAEEDTTIAEPQYTLEEVLVTASRINESPLKLPAQVTIIEGEKIRLHGVSDFGDLSYLIPSGNLSSFGYLGGLSTFTMRNGRSEQVLFLLDGRPLNDPQNGVLNISTIPLCMLHRIEVVRGGASSLWGANAMGGVVNLMTKRFGQGLPYTRIAVKNGSHNTSVSEIEFGRSAGKSVGLFVSAELKKSDGFRTNSDYNGTNIGGHLSYSIRPPWELSVGVRRYRGELGIPGDTVFFPTPNAREEDYRLDADVRLRRVSSLSETEIQVFSSETWNTYRNPDLASRETNRNNLSGIQLERRFPLLERHKGAVGFYGERAIGDLRREEWRTHVYSGFAQFDMNFSPWMDLFTATRVDLHSEYGRQLSPSIGVTFPLGTVCALYLNWNRSFRAPTLNELYYPGFGNSNLNPELSTGVELGLKMEFPTIRGGIAHFRQKVEDMIQFGVEDGHWAPYNVGDASVAGTELDIEFSREGPFSGGLNLTISEALDGSGSQIMYQPRIKAGGYVQVGKTFRDEKLEGAVLVSGEFTGERISETDEELGQYGLIHTKFLWRILNLTVFLRLRNLLDSQYEVRQGYPMPGRDHILGLEWELWD